jgi:hypothetical protein
MGSPQDQAAANALSVIDRCRSQDDDDFNANPYVRFRTFFFVNAPISVCRNSASQVRIVSAGIDFL